MTTSTHIQWNTHEWKNSKENRMMRRRKGGRNTFGERETHLETHDHVISKAIIKSFINGDFTTPGNLNAFKN